MTFNIVLMKTASMVIFLIFFFLNFFANLVFAIRKKNIKKNVFFQTITMTTMRKRKMKIGKM